MDRVVVDSSERNASSQQVASGARANLAEPARRESEDNRILIDSLPRGAEVSYLPGGSDGKGPSTLVGKTPLELDSREYPSGTFVIMMHLDAYLASIENVPALKNWIEQSGFRYEILGAAYGAAELFQFDTATTLQTVDANGSLVAVGPVYALDSSTSDRIMALFIPRGASVRDFLPLMPPDGTYELDKEAYGRSLNTDYGFDLRQASEAVESLARCGKYVTTVEVFNPTGRRSMVALSAQRGEFLTAAYALQ